LLTNDLVEKGNYERDYEEKIRRGRTNLPFTDVNSLDVETTFDKTTILLKALEEAVKSVLKADNNVSFTSKFNEYMLRNEFEAYPPPATKSM
jgi:hypothetical protein